MAESAPAWPNQGVDATTRLIGASASDRSMHVGTDGSPPPAPTAEGRAGPPSGSAAAPPAIRQIEPPGPWSRHLVVSGSEPARPTARPTVLGHGALCGAQLVLGLLLLGGVFGAVRSHADDFKMCTVDAGQTAAFTEGLSRSIAQLPTQGGTDPVSEGQKQRLQFQQNELHRGQMMACRVGSFFFAGRIATLSLSTAACSFPYNLGADVYGHGDFTTISACLAERRWRDLPAALLLYVNPGSAVEVGLRRRRQAEADLWSAGLSRLEAGTAPRPVSRSTRPSPTPS